MWHFIFGGFSAKTDYRKSTVDKYVIKILGTMVHGKMQQFK